MATHTSVPTTTTEAEQRFFARYTAHMGGSSWIAVQRFLDERRPKPASVEAWITLADEVRSLPPVPPTLNQIAAQLTTPFPPEVISLLPGATNTEKTRALAMPYADMRAYERLLDALAGPACWSTTYELAMRGVVCAVTICGVTKSAVGDYPLDPKDENPGTSAQVQAFKRACSAFGIGRYLYDLPKTWCAYDKDKKQIVDAPKIVRDLYRAARLL